MNGWQVLMGSWKEEGDSPTVIFKIEDTASGVRIKIENDGMACEAINGAKEIFDAQVAVRPNWSLRASAVWQLYPIICV